MEDPVNNTDLVPVSSSTHLLKVDLLGGAQTEQPGLYLLEEQPALIELLREGMKIVHVTQRVAAIMAGPARSCWRENKNHQILKVGVKPEQPAG